MNDLSNLLELKLVNCGNCGHMKQTKIRHKNRMRLVANCKPPDGWPVITKGVTGWFLDNGYNGLPKTWNMAKECTSFDPMWKRFK